MPTTIELTASQEMIGGKCRRVMTLVGPDSRKREFFFEFSVENPPGKLTELDPFVFGIIFLAMQERANLRVRGAMSRTALRNLIEFQAIWVSWRPKVYQQIEIIPDSVIDLPAGAVPPRAIAAFSGGADSVFTVLGHAGPAKPACALPLTDLLLVHGFDLDLDDFGAFQKLQERTHPFISSLGLRFRSIRTNLKRDSGQNWEDSFVAQLAACLHQYASEFSHALLGSSEPYISLCLPIGSSPMTDPLLSGDRMQIVLDGCRFTRTEKIAGIANSPQAVESLNVCWESASGTNCGHCEKCMRTRLNFLAAGAASPSCFATPLALRDISRMPLRTYAQYHELTSLRDHARDHGRTGAWMRALDRRIFRYRIWDHWINAARARVKRSRWIHLIRRIRSKLS